MYNISSYKICINFLFYTKRGSACLKTKIYVEHTTVILIMHQFDTGTNTTNKTSMIKNITNVLIISSLAQTNFTIKKEMDML